jgi:hypothetical protein
MRLAERAGLLMACCPSSTIHVGNGVMAPGESDGRARSMNCACPPGFERITASRATDAATSARQCAHQVRHHRAGDHVTGSS